MIYQTLIITLCLVVLVILLARRRYSWWTTPNAAHALPAKVKLHKISDHKCSIASKVSAAVGVEGFVSHMCQFSADSGMVCPPTETTSMFTIQPYQLCDENIQKAAVAHLANEWGPASLEEGYIERIWSRTDIMFVISDDSLFIGCVAVDRRNFFPVMSHLYVIPEKRGLGYGNRLLRFAERYALKLSFTEMKLWCSDDMVGYYVTKGWVQEGAKDGQMIMRKDLLTVN